MKRLQLSLFTALFCLTSSFAVAADDEGFVSLFDGKTLKGWHHTTVVEGKAKTETENVTAYYVKDGAIHCTPKGRTLHTPRTYKDFVLRMEYKLPPGGNNGIGIRTPLLGTPAFAGIEIQLLDDTADKYKTIKDYQFNGSVYGVIPAKQGHLKPVGEWNHIEVSAIGTKFKVVLNGTTIVDGDTAEASKNGTLDKREHPGLKNTEGYIALCGHGDAVQFRAISIKEIK